MSSRTLKQLAEHVGGKIVGDDSIVIDSIATLKSANSNQLTFLANSKYQKQLADTKAGAVLVTEKMVESNPVASVVVDDPYLAFAKLTHLYVPDYKKPRTGISKTASVSDNCTIASDVYVGPGAVIEDGASIGKGSQIGANSYVGFNVQIGEHCEINPNVSIYHDVKIGKNVILHSGSVIGADGFGLAKEGQSWVKIAQLGAVVLKDNVEIGANTTIDRGAIEDTVIETGVKIDNIVQVAHNCKIGDNTAIASHAAIAGSTTIGAGCTISGQSGIVGHIDITDNVHITGMTVVNKSIDEPGAYSSGTLMQPYDKWRKSAARFRQLDELAKKVRELEKKTGQSQSK